MTRNTKNVLHKSPSIPITGNELVNYLMSWIMRLTEKECAQMQCFLEVKQL